MGEMDIFDMEETADMADMPDIEDMPDMVENAVSRRETMVMEEAEVLDLPIDPGRPTVESVEALDQVAFERMEVFVFRRLTAGFISCCDNLGGISAWLSVLGGSNLEGQSSLLLLDFRRKTTSPNVRDFLILGKGEEDGSSSLRGAFWRDAG